MEIKEIPSRQAVDFLLPRHYSGRKPQISVAFGLFHEQNIVGACTFGKPASNSLCIGVCGEKLSSKVYELNRLCIEEGVDFKASQFVSFCLRQLKQRDWIIVSYSDTGMHHNGYIYQACNFFTLVRRNREQTSGLRVTSIADTIATKIRESTGR